MTGRLFADIGSSRLLLSDAPTAPRPAVPEVAGPSCQCPRNRDSVSLA